jgi:heavy metal sensor kinase
LSVYFLALLTLALGAAAVLAYRTGRETLVAKKETTEKLIQAQYKDRCREEGQRLNDALLAQAQRLAAMVDPHREVRSRLRPLHMFGMLGMDVTPGGYFLAPVWLAEGLRAPGGPPGVPRPTFVNPIWDEMNKLPDYPLNTTLYEIRFKASDIEVLEHLDGQVAEFFQVNAERYSPYRSQRLEDVDQWLPLDLTAFAPDQAVHHEFNDVEVVPGLVVHRVVLKTPPLQLLFWGGPRTPRIPAGRNPAASDTQPGREAAPAEPLRSTRFDRGTTPRELQASPVYIQCAFDRARLLGEVQKFAARRDGELADLTRETDASLTTLRNRLLLIGTVTFAATVVGCFVLVWLGLLPLRRLSEAVSRVSPKHLQLPLDQQKLPAELRPVAGRLTESLDQLRRAFEREKQATADISHELRTPLAALLTTLEIALRKSRTPDEYRELLADCHVSALQMNQTVDRLLTLARLDAGVDRLRQQPVDAADLAEQCAAVVRPLAEAHHLKLHVHRNGAAPLTTDPDKLREVVTNLLHNAVQYNRPEGAIDVIVQMTADQLQLEVSDTGIGIAPEARERIFERFYRVDPSRGTDGLHAGLGLAIVKEYVDLMGGAIAVESTVGCGSTFRITLPVTGQAA